MRRRLAALLALLLLLVGCGAKAAPSEATEGIETAEAVELTEEERRDAAIWERIAAMPLETKVGQLFFVRCPERDAAEAVEQYHLGGVLLFTRDYQNASGEWLSREAFDQKIADLQESSRRGSDLPLFIGSDEEGGSVTRASRNPNLFSRKRSSPRSVYAAGGMEEIAREARDYHLALGSLGVNVNFAPVCDVSVNPADFIYDRALGRDAEETAEFVRTVVAAAGDAGVSCVLKHFPGYGNNADTHTGIAIDNRPRETFETSDFLPFRAGVEAGAPFVLVSHNIVNCMDETLPASLSAEVHRVLREEVGFDGVILTDDLAMDAVAAYAKDGSAAVLALRAGNDMLVTSDFEAQIARLLAALADGSLDEAVVDAAVFRVLRAKEMLER